MRIGTMAAAILILVSGASAEDYGHPTAFVVNPIHEAQIVRGDDGMDHVEYDLLIVSVELFAEVGDGLTGRRRRIVGCPSLHVSSQGVIRRVRCYRGQAVSTRVVY